MLAIIGATASGKSGLASTVAKQTRVAILSVDSMQVYRELNIGTAKAPQAERDAIPHYLLDLVEPDQEFSAAEFVERADLAIADCASRGERLIATGGTPMYFKALFQGLFEGPGADAGLREKLRTVDGAELHARLAAVDPVAARRIHAADQRRLIRALEVFELTQTPITELQKEWANDRPARHPAVWVGLSWDKDALNRRINARVKEMIAAGWVDEVRQLIDQFPRLSQTAAGATGYRELIEHVRGRMTLNYAIEQIKISTRQLARRQMKWFRRFPNVHWLAGDLPIEALTAATVAIWNQAQES